jgi:hypothetical protein
MFLRTTIVASALLAAVPAAALDVIASFTPTVTSTGNFAPVTALLTGLVEGNNLGSNIGFTLLTSPVAGSLTANYFRGRSEFGVFGDDQVAITVSGGQVTAADYYWYTSNLYFSISKNSTSIPQIADFNSGQYAESRTLDTFESIPTTFKTAPAPGVPEPASWAMLIAGFGLVGAAMRRRAIGQAIA